MKFVGEPGEILARVSLGRCLSNMIYPLVNIQKAMVNTSFQWIDLLNMVIFYATMLVCHRVCWNWNFHDFGRIISDLRFRPASGPVRLLQFFTRYVCSLVTYLQGFAT